MKKNAFTLIELLAVIVILAIILVISIPKILDVIETSKKDSFKNAAQLIADSAEKKKVSDKLLGKDESITCKDVAKISDEDYASCKITFDSDGIAKVSIVGKGKFKRLKVIDGTKENAEVIELEAPKYGITAVEYINELYEYDSDTNGLKIDNTEDKNIRYYGSDPNNYVKFNNELWRIIGVFGNNVKLIRKDILGRLSWSKGESAINNGYGINQWGESTYEDGSSYEGADLQVYLNKMYYGGDTTITCYNNTSTCPKDINGNFLTLDNTSKVLVDKHIWNVGGVELSKAEDTLAFYQAERGTKSGKTCTNGDRCNDTIIRTTEWVGYVALPYVTDWAYASENKICEINMLEKDSSNAYVCKNNNWLHRNSSWTWFLSPSSIDACFVWSVFSAGYNNSCYASNVSGVAPSIYLKSEIIIQNGDGSEGNPYILSI